MLFRSIYYFKAAAFFKQLRFRKSHFLAVVIFSEYLIFRNETSNEQQLCENRKFFRAVPFRNSYLFGGVIAQNKDIYRRAPLIEAGTSAFSKNILFLESYLFWAATFSYELLSHNILFQRSCYFIAALPLHSYTYYLSVSK